MLTYDELIRLDREGKFVELINGVLYNHPAPAPEHQDVLGNLFFTLKEYVLKNKIGRIFIAPVDVIFSKTDVVQPDLIFISNKNLQYLTRRGFESAPDLVVEVISEFTKEYDVQKKRALYATYNVPFFWLIDPFEKKIEIYELVKPGYYELKHVYLKNDKFGTPLFPDLLIDCKFLFEW